MPNAKVVLTIQKAESLVALNPGGTSNPYITATIGSQSVTTPVREKTLNPLFDACFTFVDCPLPTILTLQVLNKIQFVDVEDPLGSATMTLFDFQPTLQAKVLQLSHGGNASLAQRAPQGCGRVSITYEVLPMDAQAAETAPAVAASAATPTPAAPLLVPAALNMSGTPALPLSLPTPSDGRAGSGSASLFALHPRASPPAAATPPLRPLGESSPSASSLHQLTPPSVAPARVPSTTAFLIPQAAMPPPSLTSIPVLQNPSSAGGYTSYAVPGAKAPSPPLAEPVLAPSLPDGGIFYANNTTAGPVAPPATLGLQPNVSGSMLLPVAAAAPSVGKFATLQESTNASRSLEASLHPAMPSSLFLNAAQAPATGQQKLLVVPPHIEGIPLVTSLYSSAAASREVSRLPSAAQLPISMNAAAASFPTLASPPPPGVLPVAQAPPSPPLHSSSSTATSRLSSPPTLSSNVIRPAALQATPTGGAAAPSGQEMMPPIPAAPPRVLQQSEGNGTSGGAIGGMQRGVAPVPAPATAALGSVQSPSANWGAAVPLDTMSPTPPAAAGLVSPKRRSAKRESSPVSSSAGATVSSLSAAQLYADRLYLLEMAAKGGDLAMFHHLREVDPALTSGFASCVDYAGRSLLHIAAWHGQLRVLQILLAPTPVVPMVDLYTLVAATSGNTILHAAACGGQAEVAQWLRYSHPTAGPLLLAARNLRGMTAAECAAEAGFPQVAALLMPH